jgi:hypothetical protein
MRQTLVLEICSSADSLSGILRDADGVAHAFSGWLGFASAIESAIRPWDDEDTRDHPGRQRR